jgi:hypothetical protein
LEQGYCALYSQGANITSGVSKNLLPLSREDRGLGSEYFDEKRVSATLAGHLCLLKQIAQRSSRLRVP